ncbi:MAG: hypothetical protein B6D35_09600 [Candidatus Brocadia sp. UTAMX2]|jgi:energy-coupling factor transport system ATP-binding protein|nr:MAG: hypothetical protein B6D35_09600 [Candidatus Brocadia sp. UTAMX2]
MLKLEPGWVKYYKRQGGEQEPFVLTLQKDYMFDPGDIVAFVGSNGAGKSTLLNCVTGLNEKQYHRDGIKTTWYHNEHVLNPASAVVAYLEAHPSLLEIYCVHDYMKLADYSRKSIAKHMKVQYKSITKQEIEETIKIFNLEKVSNYPTDMLSSGQKKRLGLAMIHLQQAPFIILDEPRAYLDKEGENLVKELINTWEKCGKIVFTATHDVKDIYLSKRFFLVEKNEVKELSNREEVLKWMENI